VGFTPAYGSTFDILVNNSGAAITGTFANLAKAPSSRQARNKFRIYLHRRRHRRDVPHHHHHDHTARLVAHPSNQEQLGHVSRPPSPVPGAGGTVSFLDQHIAIAAGPTSPFPAASPPHPQHTTRRQPFHYRRYNGTTNFGAKHFANIITQVVKHDPRRRGS